MDAGQFLDWHRRAVRYAFSLTHDADDAQAAVHEAFIRLADRGGPGSLGYLLGTVRNIVFETRRFTARRSRQAAPFHPDTLRAPDPSPADRVGQRLDSRAAVARILAMLEPEERELLFLADVEEMSGREIARLTGRTRRAILAQLARLRARIRASVPNPFHHHHDESLHPRQEPSDEPHAADSA